MDTEIIELIKNIATFPGAAESEIDSVAKSASQSFAFSLPKQYIDLMKFSNGVGGFIGEDEYLSIYSIDEIISINKALPVKDVASQLGLSIFIFGSDGSDLHYGFKQDSEGTSVVSVDFYESAADSLDFMANTLNEFLKLLSQS
jgi:hypothetical protein